MMNKKQLDFAKNFVSSGSIADAYRIAYKCKNKHSCAVNGARLLKKEEIADFVERLRRAKEQQIIDTRATEITALKQQVLHETELDFFHSQVLRGEMLVEEIYQVREYVPVMKDEAGNIIQGTGRWAVTFKRVTRPPNIREKQISADMLYRRKGSYAPLKIKPMGNGSNDNDNNGEYEPEERVIILSDGKRLPFPGTKQG